MRRWLVYSCVRSYGVFLWISLVVFSPSCVSAADAEVQRVNKVKAAIVLNIARFVTWPEKAFEQDNDHLLLCFYHFDPFAGSLDSISGKTVAGRKLNIIRIDNIAETRLCQILLISQADLNILSARLHPAMTQPLLTIADRTHIAIEPSISKGVMVSLVRTGTRIGFEIDLERARSAGLKMSSELLKHAKIVDGDR